MKNSNEIANDLIKRREVYKQEQHLKRNKSIKITSSISCCCLVAILGIGVWQGDLSVKQPSVNNEENHGILAGEHSSDGKGKQPNTSESSISKDEINQDSLIDWKGEIISSYGENTAASACYATPDNNSYGMSTPLRGALQEYGDSARYMVVVDIFKNKELVSTNKEILEAEAVRLSNLGYETLIEVNNLGSQPIYYFVMQISKEQLENFDVNEEYGYFFFIRGERID